MQPKKIIAGLFIVMGSMITSCKNDFLPDKDNHSSDARFASDPGFAEGVLLNAYVNLPNAYSLDEVATDDAVTNDKTNTYLRMATGEWSALFTPVSVWSTAYQQIYYINYFLSIVNTVTFAYDDRAAPSAERNQMFKDRFTGEALALRAWYYFDLLKRHGGIATDGTPRGFVIVDQVLNRDDNVNLPRNTYADCVAFILKDLDKASTLLPDVYANKGTDVNYNAVFGVQNKNRVNGLFVKALKARLLLHVASQSFITDADKWDKAATAAAALITPYGGPAGLSATGLTWWKAQADKEILFRRDYANLNSREVSNFPPSLFGNGQTNPSQNLVDAFPASNGYPITSLLSGYQANNPYANRDPRLKLYVLYNGNTINTTVINTNVEAAKNGLGQTTQSTRTGYYLKKLLQETINLSPSSTTTAQHFYTLFRYTELFLNYAEAANEAWGPTGDPKGNGYTAATIMAAIRKRAGFTTDPYLASITGSQSAMRDFIRNERRIELCFEGFRFWDMRRWNLDLTQPVNGMSISAGTYNIIKVEDRLYKPYMIYGPIPAQELLKGTNTIQNAGW